LPLRSSEGNEKDIGKNLSKGPIGAFSSPEGGELKKKDQNFSGTI
jgi:hypothetical protein